MTNRQLIRLMLITYKQGKITKDKIYILMIKLGLMHNTGVLKFNSVSNRDLACISHKATVIIK